MANTATTLSDRYVLRFFSKFVFDDGCWEWRGSIKPNGYGYFSLWPKKVYAHRLSYELLVGPIPDGMHIDHICFNRRCVRPDHLDAVTQKVNNQRAHAIKTHCAQGHPWIDENIATRPNGSHYCRVCNREQQRRRKALSRARKAPLADFQPGQVLRPEPSPVTPCCDSAAPPDVLNLPSRCAITDCNCCTAAASPNSELIIVSSVTV